VHHKDSHDYLGMVMSHDVENKKVTIDMRKCIQEFQDQEPDERIKLVNTPIRLGM
jgi:hypothetical protein